MLLLFILIVQAAPNKYQAFPEIAIDWATAFTKLINKFNPHHIFICDTTALFVCLMCFPELVICPV